MRKVNKYTGFAFYWLLNQLYAKTYGEASSDLHDGRLRAFEFLMTVFGQSESKDAGVLQCRKYWQSYHPPGWLVSGDAVWFFVATQTVRQNIEYVLEQELHLSTPIVRDVFYSVLIDIYYAQQYNNRRWLEYGEKAMLYYEEIKQKYLSANNQ